MNDIPADLVDFLAQLEAADRRAGALAVSLSHAQGNWRPALGASWSIVQCIEHMGLTNRAYMEAIRQSAPHAKLGHKALQAGGWFSRYFLKKTEPPASVKIKAPKKIQPASSVSLEKALNDFLQSNQEVRTFVMETAALNLCATRFRNPFVPGLNFTIATGLLVIAAHNRRHLWQAETVRNASDFPA